MRTKQITKVLSILILSGILILSCKKAPEQSTEVESVSTTKLTPLSLLNNETYGQITKFITDYLSVGTGGLQDDSGEINVIGTFPLSSVTKAYGPQKLRLIRPALLEPPLVYHRLIAGHITKVSPIAPM